MTDTDLREENWKKEFDKFFGRNDIIVIRTRKEAESFIKQLILTEREKERKETAIKIVNGLDEFISTPNEPNCGNVMAAQWGIMKGWGIEPDDLDSLQSVVEDGEGKK